MNYRLLDLMATGGLQTPDGVDSRVMDFIRSALVSAVAVNADSVARFYYEGGAPQNFDFRADLPNFVPAFKSLWIDVDTSKENEYVGGSGNTTPESRGALLYANVILKPDEWRADVTRWAGQLQGDLAEVIAAWESQEIRWTYEVFLFVLRKNVPLGPVACLSMAITKDGVVPLTVAGKPAMICRVYSKKQADGSADTEPQIQHYAAEATDLLKPILLSAGLLNSMDIRFTETRRARSVSRKLVKTGSPIADKPYYELGMDDVFHIVRAGAASRGEHNVEALRCHAEGLRNHKNSGTYDQPGAYWWEQHF